MPTSPIILDLYTVGQVAQLFGVSPQTVRNWADSGKLPATRTPGGRRMFKRADVAKYLEGSAATEAAS